MGTIGKLKALAVAKAKTPGMYGDGGGLYLQVTGAGARSWIFRYWVPQIDPATGNPARDPQTNRPRGVSREMGLGSLSTVTLETARELAGECRKLRQKGIDPLEARQRAKQQVALEKAKAITFRDAATTYIESHRAGWRNAKHAGQWTATLEAYAYPTIGAVSVQDVDTTLVHKILEPIWSTKAETASRVRGRVELILDWATARGYRTGENPARWRGHMDKILPPRSKVQKVRHYPALPYQQVPAFLASLRTHGGAAAAALEFTILAAARTEMTIAATLPEIDKRDGLWTLSAERMKADREHRVPLSDRALEIVREMGALRGDSPYVFPGGKRNQSLSNMAMLAVIRRMNEYQELVGDPKWIDPRQGKEVVPHGFRSSFRDWAAERTNFPSEVVEMALAHAVGGKVEAAYRRGDLFEKRRRLMEAWARYCKSPAKASGAAVVLGRATA